MAAEGTVAAAELQPEGEGGGEPEGGFGQLLEEEEEGEDGGYVLYRYGRDEAPSAAVAVAVGRPGGRAASVPVSGRVAGWSGEPWGGEGGLVPPLICWSLKCSLHMHEYLWRLCDRQEKAWDTNLC